MEKELQTSFIPKKPISEERVQTRSKPVGFLMLFSVLVFIVSVLFAVGVYFYRSYLEDKISSLETSLVRAEDEFERGLIDELERLERRLSAGSEIISQHIVVSPIFAFLEDTTLPSVRFTDFSFTRGKDGSASIEVNLEGEALSYTEIALQSDLLSKNRNFRNVVFSDLALSDRGTVSFSLYFVVDPSFVRFVGSAVNTGVSPSLNNQNQTNTTPNTNSTQPAPSTTVQNPNTTQNTPQAPSVQEEEEEIPNQVSPTSQPDDSFEVGSPSTSSSLNNTLEDEEI